MPCVYPRGDRLYCRLKDEKGKWFNKVTPYRVGQEADADRFVAESQALLDRRRGKASSPEAPLTVERYATMWCDEREERGVRAAEGDRAILRNHVLPVLGHVVLRQLRTDQVRDFVRQKVREGRLAARSVGNVYGTLHTMLEDAVTEGRVPSNPVRVKRGELPRKLDRDPEWRGQATYQTHEVVSLVSDVRVPPERRVLYALKALAGLRHGEAAAMRWRHWDAGMKPLGRLTVAVSFDSHRLEEKRTKTGTTRYVPVHPALALVLTTWRTMRKEALGREPGPDDLVVPFFDGGPVNKNDAQGALLHDLGTLGLRLRAGALRNRGGHDLRSFFKTQCVEDGADSQLIRRVTHAPPKDVDSGYLRFSWQTFCREVARLQVELPADPLAVQPEGYGPTEGNYWRNGWRRAVRPAASGDEG